MRFTADEQQRLYAKLSLELGGTISSALKDEHVTEICVNADGLVRIERVGAGFEVTQTHFTPDMVVGLLGTIATLQGTTINRFNPILESWIPGDGARIEGVVPPVSRSPVFAIRKPSRRVFSLQDYVVSGRMGSRAAEALTRAVADKLNIVIVGGTGTGKTTLANALVREMEAQFSGIRLGILEGTRELLTSSGDHFQFEVVADSGIDLERLLVTALRMRPDRIIVGEARGNEALTLLRAWNTGHPGGVTSVHANSAASGLRRLEQLAGRGLVAPGLRFEIAETVGVVVFVERTSSGPRVREVLRVHGYRDEEYILEDLSGAEAHEQEMAAR